MDALLRECNVGQTVLLHWFSDSDPAVWETKVIEYDPDTKKLKLEFTYDGLIYTYLPHELTKEHIKIFESDELGEDENLSLLFG
ncbi:hypothetical protein SIPHO082v1_p0070 [Vibrio phage 294E48.1]|nr:hypothetical protein SIPHO082v1_p0070 [Vibrio phage 294E48.1]